MVFSIAVECIFITQFSRGMQHERRVETGKTLSRTRMKS